MRYILILFFLFSCSKVEVEKKKEGVKEITLWETYGEEEHKEILKIAKMFEERNPGVKINIRRIPWGDHQTKLMTSMITNTAPDIARVDIAFMPRLVASNSVLDLKKLGEVNPEDYIPAAIQSCIFKKNGEIGIYGLPDQITGVCLFYNKKAFKEAGIEKPPKTWEEFIEVAKKLTVDKDGDGKIDQFGFGMDYSLWWTFPFFNTFGVKFLSEDGKKCLLDSPEGKKALQLKVDLYRKFKVEGGAWQSGAIPVDMGFMNGIYAMIFTGPWNVKRFKEAGIDFGIALIPEGPAGTSTNVGGTDMVIMRKAKNPELCFKFLKFLTSPRIQAMWAMDLGQIPVNVKAVQFIDFSKCPEVKIFFEQMKTAIPRPKVLSYDRLEMTVNPYLYAALTGKMTVKKALKEIKEKIEKDILAEE
ncbi:MAG: hypothetical protein DRI36_01330 [Caldiserica bacterium]|nr:MAG: hypothetical protein DRI36_01330 [Caldisericota bacterium]